MVKQIIINSLLQQYSLKNFTASQLLLLENTILLQENGKLTIFKADHNYNTEKIAQILTSNIPKQLLPKESILQLSSNSEVIHAITENGKLFSWGNDSKKSGILGLGGVYQQNEPTLIDSTRKFIHISTGATHAGAIDEIGKTFLWGENYQNTPECFHNITHTRLLRCANQVTGFLTVGGKIYIGRNELSNLMHVKGHSITCFFRDIVLLPFGGVALTGLNQYFDLLLRQWGFIPHKQISQRNKMQVQLPSRMDQSLK